MTSGQLNKPVTIERDQGIAQDFGEGTVNWVAYRQPWASIEPRTSAERVVAQGVETLTSHVIRIRKDPERPIDTTMRIVYGNRRFAIKGIIDPGEKGDILVIDADETTRWGAV